MQQDDRGKAPLLRIRAPVQLRIKGAAGVARGPGAAQRRWRGPRKQGDARQDPHRTALAEDGAGVEGTVRLLPLHAAIRRLSWYQAKHLRAPASGGAGGRARAAGARAAAGRGGRRGERGG